MITIYMLRSLHEFVGDAIPFLIKKETTNEEIFKYIVKFHDENKSIVAYPSSYSNLFKENFITPHLDKKGYVIKEDLGKVYRCEIKGKIFDYILKYNDLYTCIK